MAKQRDLYKEAIADSKKMKQAAMKSGYKMLAENFKEALEETVEAELNEEADEDDETMDESYGSEDEGTMSEMFEDEDVEMEEEGDDDLDLGLDSDSEFGGEDDLDEGAGFDEEDLQEVLRQVLDEVEHPQLGEFENIDVDTHDTGLMDEDGKETGWEEKTVPAKKDWTVKEAAYKSKIKMLALENAKLKKGYKTLRETYREVDTFNKKLFFLNKLMDNRVVRENKGLKEGIIKKLDAAQTAKEAQNIYESLNMAIGLISEKNASKKGKRTSTLSETLGSQSRNERGVSNVRQDHLLLTEDAKFGPNRMMVLAGLVDED